MSLPCLGLLVLGGEALLGPPRAAACPLSCPSPQPQGYSILPAISWGVVFVGWERTLGFSGLALSFCEWGKQPQSGSAIFSRAHSL